MIALILTAALGWPSVDGSELVSLQRQIDRLQARVAALEAKLSPPRPPADLAKPHTKVFVRNADGTPAAVSTVEITVKYTSDDGTAKTVRVANDCETSGQTFALFRMPVVNRGIVTQGGGQAVVPMADKPVGQIRISGRQRDGQGIILPVEIDYGCNITVFFQNQ